MYSFVMCKFSSLHFVEEFRRFLVKMVQNWLKSAKNWLKIGHSWLKIGKQIGQNGPKLAKIGEEGRVFVSQLRQ